MPAGGAADLGSRLRRAWSAFRNRRFGDPAFHSLAARLPFARPVLRSEARALHDIVAGFVHSQVLAALIELDLLRLLATGPKTIAEIAAAAALAPEPAERLARAASALRLLEPAGAGYGLGPLGAALLGAPGLAEMVRHHRLFYADLADPVALLRETGGTHLSRFWSYTGGGPVEAADARRYSALMAVSQTLVAEETLAVAPLRGARHLLDIGGGEGVFLVAACRLWPDLRATLMDLPEVAALAAPRFAAAGLGARTAIRPGSFLADPLPDGADAISLVRVLYDHDDRVAADLLRRAHAALPPGGRLILSEPMAGSRRPNRAGDLYFGLYTLAMRSGRPRSPKTYARLLEAAGFSRIRPHRTARGVITSVMSARRA